MTHLDGMRVDLRFLSEEKTRHGKQVLYVRWKGRRIRLMSPPSSPEFLDEYRAALKALAVVDAVPSNRAAPDKHQVYEPRTFGWLVRRYFAESPAFKTMKPVGQIRRRRSLEQIAAVHGHKPMAIPTDRIAAGLAKRADKPGAANEWLKSLKALYSWALSIRLLTTNPADGVAKLKRETEGFHTWSLDEIRAYFARHQPGSMARLACVLLLFTGLRRSDAVKLGRQHIRGDVIRFRTGKTGAELVAHVPWPLAQAIAAMPERGELAFLLTGQGKAFASGNAFGNRFKDWCGDAGLAHCTAHGLRKAGATIAAEHGASEVELDAMYGWSNPRQSGTYTKAARNLVLATAGFKRISDVLIREAILAVDNPTDLPRTSDHLT